MRKIAIQRVRILILIPVVVVTFLAVFLGATGYLNKMNQSRIHEELRIQRQALAQTIRDPDELKEVLETREKELQAFYGLDKPWYFQLPGFVIRSLKFDWGYAKTVQSSKGSSKISDILAEKIPKTIIIMLPPLLLLAIINIPTGVFLATKPRSRIDRIANILSVPSYAAPTWWAGILLILILGVWLGWLPTGGMYSTPPPLNPFLRVLDQLKHAILPWATIFLVSWGAHLLVNRSLALRVAQEDFVTYARIQGFSENSIRWHYVLRGAAPAILTRYAFDLIAIVSGSMLVEIVFNWPGMGKLYYEAIAGTPDQNLAVAITYIYTLMTVAIRFCLDVFYLLLDPRIRY